MTAVDPRHAVSAPAIGLIAISALSMLTLVTGLAFNTWLLASGTAAEMTEPVGMSHEAQVGIRMIIEVIMLGMHALTIAGALRMRSLRGYGLARVGAVLACIPCCSPCLMFGIPFGVWALVVLARPEVREAFTD